MTATLLPPNATAAERAIEGAAARVGDVPVPIADLYTPSTCPSAALTWLAWAEDAPVWRRTWDERLRRGIVAASWRLHRLQGTLAGLKDLAVWADAEVRRAVVPPGTRVAGASLTQGERNAFVAVFPQLRIYRHRNRGLRAPRAAMGHADYLGHTWPVLSEAPLRIAPRAYLWQAGTETPLVVMERTEQLTTSTAVTTTHVAKRSTAGFGAFLGRIPRWLMASTAAARLYVMTISTPYVDSATVLRRKEVSPGGTPVTVHPDHVAEAGMADGIFTRGFVRGFWRETSARARLYDRLYLFDPAMAPGLRHAVSFMSGYLGMPPHRAIIQVAIRGRRSARAAGRFVAGCLVPSDSTILDTVRKALAWGQRVSDHVLMDTTTRRPLLAGAGTLAGRVMAGAQVNA